MINLLAYNLIHNLISNNCDIFLECDMPKFIGRQNEKGEVLYGQKNFEYIGLTDKKGNYLYIRLTDQKTSYQIKNNNLDPYTKSYLVSTPIKLVIVYADYNPEVFELKITNDLIGVDFVTFDKKRRPILEVISSTSDYEKIFKEETGKDISGWSGAVKLLSYDLTIKYNMDFESCLNLPDLCSEIDYNKFVDLKKECKTMDELILRLNAL